MAAHKFLGAEPLRAPSKVLVISPHPDDEIIGAGTRLPLLENVIIVQVTDGSPRNLADARTNGFSTREDYAHARCAELNQALALAGYFHTIHLDLPDQEAALHLVPLTLKIFDLIERVSPEVILTVPYEGGHPDHDATAFAVHSALLLIPARSRPALIEMSAYHSGPNGCTYNSFLNSAGDETRIELSQDQCALKRRMFDCFRTQAHVLKWFPIGFETFRFAPHYDFTAAPHSGRLYYENFEWGMTGARWRELAGDALSTLTQLTPA